MEVELTVITPVLSSDVMNDLALLRADFRPQNYAFFSDGDSTAIGTDVLIAGFPLRTILSTSGSVSAGVIRSLTGFNDDTCYYQISAPVQPGNSVGPLIDKSGNVVGIVGKLDALAVADLTGDIPQNTNFAIKSLNRRVNHFQMPQHFYESS